MAEEEAVADVVSVVAGEEREVIDSIVVYQSLYYLQTLTKLLLKNESSQRPPKTN